MTIRLQQFGVDIAKPSQIYKYLENLRHNRRAELQQQRLQPEAPGEEAADGDAAAAPSSCSWIRAPGLVGYCRAPLPRQKWSDECGTPPREQE